jgi:WD40 repeat protein
MSGKARERLRSQSEAAQMRLDSNARAFMATGGQDETIQLYDLTKMRILGNLHQHNHEVSCLAFFKSKNLLSGDADGLVNVWRCYDWQLLESMTGHKGRVNSIR